MGLSLHRKRRRGLTHRLIGLALAMALIPGMAVFPSPEISAAEYYHVRTAWNQPASQLGAFTILNNAIRLAQSRSGYEVYNSRGLQIWPALASATPAPTAAPSPTPLASSTGAGTYTVVRGDTWWGLGQKFKISYNTIAAYNGMTTSQHIYVGQILKIPGASVVPSPTAGPAPTSAPGPSPSPAIPAVPPAGGTDLEYTVRPGDTWWGLGQQFKISYNTIAAYNGMTSVQHIYVGQILKIPGANPAPTAVPTAAPAPTKVPEPSTAPPTPTSSPSAAPTAVPQPTQVPAPTAVPTPPALTESIHTIRRGDTWWGLGLTYGLDYSKIAAYNFMAPQDNIYAGQLLLIPPDASASRNAGTITVSAQQARALPSIDHLTKVYDQPGTYVVLERGDPVNGLGPGSTVYLQRFEKVGPKIFGISHTGARFCVYSDGVAFMERRDDPGQQQPPEVAKSVYTVTQMPTTIWNGIGMGYIITTPNGKTVVIDGGMQILNGDATGTLSGYGTGEEASLLSFLQKNSASQVDAWFWTHLHNDHTNAASALINKGLVHVEMLYGVDYTPGTYPDQTPAEKAYTTSAREKMKQAGRYEGMVRGGAYVIDGLVIEVLSANEVTYRENDRSAVLKLTFGTTGRTMLVTADIQDSILSRLIANNGSRLKADILQMAHHGNDDLSTLYAQVKPSWVLVPASRQNINRNPRVTAHIESLRALSNPEIYLAEDRWVTITIR